MGPPLNNSAKSTRPGFTSQYRIWIKFILDCASFQRIGLTFIVKGFSVLRVSHQNYIKIETSLKYWKTSLLPESNYPPFMSSAINPVQEADIRRKKRRRRGILKVKPVNGLGRRKRETLLRKRYVRGKQSWGNIIFSRKTMKYGDFTLRPKIFFTLWQILRYWRTISHSSIIKLPGITPLYLNNLKSVRSANICSATMKFWEKEL